MKNKCMVCLVLLCLQLVLGATSAAAGSILWVDDNWSEVPKGDSIAGHTKGTTAFHAIQDAVDAAIAGDVIHVFPGVYAENLDVDKLLTIRSTGGAAVTIVDAGAL